MKKLLMAAAAVAALGAAVPAAAQSWYTDRADRDDRIEMRIDRGLADGSLTRYEARRLRMQLNQVERLEARYRYNGLTAWELRDLDRRYDAIARQLRWERNDTQYRYRDNPRPFGDRDRDGIPNVVDPRPYRPNY